MARLAATARTSAYSRKKATRLMGSDFTPGPVSVSRAEQSRGGEQQHHDLESAYRRVETLAPRAEMHERGGERQHRAAGQHRDAREVHQVAAVGECRPSPSPRDARLLEVVMRGK